MSWRGGGVGKGYTISKDDRAVSPDFATFSRPNELANRRLFAVGVPFGLGSLLGSGCLGQNVL